MGSLATLIAIDQRLGLEDNGNQNRPSIPCDMFLVMATLTTRSNAWVYKPYGVDAQLDPQHDDAQSQVHFFQSFELNTQ